MKLINVYFIGIIFLLLSCEVLEQEPQDKISTDQAFANENNAKSAINGLYNEVQSIYDWRMQTISDVMSDITQSIDTWDAFINMDEYRITQDNSEVEDLYTILYRAVDIANNIITEVPKLKLPIDRENDLLGQAYGIRGLMYFELSRFWGGIPGVYGELGVIVRTEPSKGIDSDSFGYRLSLTDTYERARLDLEKALQLLPETRKSNLLDKSRMVKATASALLSRLHLYLHEYSKAEQYATKVINDSRYELVKPYAEIFQKKNTNESIFEMQYSLNDISGLRNWYYPSSTGGRGGLALHEEFYQELTANFNDERGRMVAFNQSAGVYYPTKYDLPGNASNTHIIRIAELYLNRAEARAYQNHLVGAQEDLNAIRNRAGLDDTRAYTQEELIALILQERKLEFFGEGHRWFDLVRTGTAVNILTNLQRKTGSQPVSLTDSHRQVLPFPSSEVLANPNLIQNDAYK